MDDSQNSTPQLYSVKSHFEFELTFWIHDWLFYCFSPTELPVGEELWFNSHCSCSGLRCGFYMVLTQPSTGWDSKAQRFKLAYPPVPVPRFSPQCCHAQGRSLSCLFTICCGNPQFFVAINNWAVWSGHSTKGCSFCLGPEAEEDRAAKERGDTPAWRKSRSSPPFLCSCLSLSGLHLFLFVCTVQHTLSPQSESDLPLPSGTHHK